MTMWISQIAKHTTGWSENFEAALYIRQDPTQELKVQNVPVVICIRLTLKSCRSQSQMSAQSNNSRGNHINGGERCSVRLQSARIMSVLQVYRHLESVYTSDLSALHQFTSSLSLPLTLPYLRPLCTMAITLPLATLYL